MIEIDLSLEERKYLEQFVKVDMKKTWGEGVTMPLEYRQDRMTKSIKQFFQRGFKRI